MTQGGVSQLGYLGFSCRDLAAWAAFAGDVVGLVVTRVRDDALALRLDDYVQRITIERGDDDDLAFVGWQVDDEPTLEAIVERLGHAGVAVREGDAELAAKRCVSRVVSLSDPAGTELELFCGPQRITGGFTSSVIGGSFVAGAQGLGHLVVTADDNATHEAFYCDLLGLGVTDYIEQELGGHKLNLVFLHANRRHHSLAFGGKQNKRIHHFGLQIESLDDLGRTLDRMVRAGVPVVSTLGRHPNDQMLSFYAQTPGGFQIELGWGGRTIDPEHCTPITYHRWRDWGHLPPRALVAHER